MEAYAEYKDSGVDWIGEIPADWAMKRVQDLVTYNDSVVDEVAIRNQEIKYVDIASVDAKTNTYTFERMDFSRAPSRARRVVKNGDTVFSTVRPYLKAVATISNSEANLVVSTGFAVARPKKCTESRFLGYLLRNESFINEVSANSVGASYPAINAFDLFKIKTPFPSFKTQTAIAGFLDDKVDKVEELVEIKQAQIALLKERKQTLIQETVTKGLNRDAPMKDSGIDWIGQIPSHWDRTPNKHLFRLKKRLVGKKSAEFDLLSLTLRGIIKRDMDNPEGKFPAEFDTYQEVDDGNFVFCHFDVEETPRTVGLSTFDGMITGAYTVYECTLAANSRFLYLFYLCADTDKKLRPLYKGLRNTIPRDSFGAFKTPLPPLEEQKEIVKHTDKMAANIDDTIIIKEKQITKLNEYKVTLINAAVTGKIRVPEKYFNKKVSRSGYGQ